MLLPNKSENGEHDLGKQYCPYHGATTDPCLPNRVVQCLRALKAAISLSWRLFRRLLYDAQTLWLFTKSDRRSILEPTLVSSLVNSVSATQFGLREPTFATIAVRMLLVFAWCWINLLSLCVNNQMTPVAIEEDRINKPWRPLPQSRLTISMAQKIFFAGIPSNCVVSWYIGGFEQTICLTLLNLWYNQGQGGENPYSRNLINACGFGLYASAGFEIVLRDQAVRDSRSFILWLAFVGGIIGTTIQIQDLRDEEGDALRGRSTLPLLIGDWTCRVSVAVPVAFWSLICVVGCGMSYGTFLTVSVPAILIIYRTFAFKGKIEDNATFKIWGLWLISIYCLPLTR